MIVLSLPTARYPSAGPTRYFGAATMGSMALIVFFRGINLGGHRAFARACSPKNWASTMPSTWAPQAPLSFANLGCAHLAELRRKRPFEATIAFCDGSDL